MGKIVDFILGRNLESRSDSRWTQEWETPFGPTAGMLVSNSTTLGLSAAWNAVGLLSDAVSTLPIDAVIEQGGRRIPVAPLDRPRWLDNPGNGLSPIDLLSQTMVSLLLRGEAFYLTPRFGGQVLAIAAIDPESVAEYGGGWRVNGVEIQDGEFALTRGMMMPGSKRGMGVITYARESIAGNLAAQKFGESFFGNGAWVGATVEVPGVLSEDGQKAIINYVNERHRGAARAHKIGVLTEGAKLSRPLTFSAEDSQFLQTREFGVADVARWFRVPPEMIGGKSTDALTYSTLEGRSTHFVKYSVLPWVVRIEQTLTSLWQSEGGPENGQIKLKLDGLLRGSTKERYDSYTIALSSGFMTVDEVRALEDLPPLPKEAEAPTPEVTDGE
jgi:HK97 family phage portal protein